jgi:hypothetical protein
MAKLGDKEHEQQQERRLAKLEKRVDALKDELSKHKAKPKH